MSIQVYDSDNKALIPVAGRVADGLDINDVKSLADIQGATSFKPSDVASASALKSSLDFVSDNFISKDYSPFVQTIGDANFHDMENIRLTKGVWIINIYFVTSSEVDHTGRVNLRLQDDTNNIVGNNIFGSLPTFRFGGTSGTIAVKVLQDVTAKLQYFSQEASLQLRYKYSMIKISD